MAANYKNEVSFALEEDDRILNIQLEGVEQHVLEHVRSCDDITLITSLDRDTRSKTVEGILKKYSKEIRAFFLGSEFFHDDGENDSATISDLSEIADVVLGSIHTEKYFVVVLDDAEDFQAGEIEDLCEVINSLNEENNHIGILMVCDPIFVNIMKGIEAVSDLRISECSLDKINQDDIQAYIDDRQDGIASSKKLLFEPSALKTIATHATGSIFEASILLEWCRLFAQHKQTLKITSALVNQMFSELLSISPQAGSNLLADYPPANISFNEILKDPSSDEKVKPFIQPTASTKPKAKKSSADKSKAKSSPKKPPVKSVAPIKQEKNDVPTLQTREQVVDEKPKDKKQQPAENIEANENNQAEEKRGGAEKQNKMPVVAWLFIVGVIAYCVYYFYPELTKLKQEYFEYGGS